MRTPVPFALPACWMTLLCLAGCSRGGGSSGGSSSAVTLERIEFPDPSGQSGSDPEQAPQNASLIQQIVFVFSGAPDADSVHPRSLPILDAEGVPVIGRYAVAQRRVTFTPALPRAPFDVQNGTTVDNGGAALWPGQRYTVRVTAGRRDSISNLVGISETLRGRFPDPQDPAAIELSFRTTTNPLLFLTGLDGTAVHPIEITPPDGTQAYSPFLYTDPAGEFGPPVAVEIEFDGPLLPDSVHLSDAHYRLVDLDDTSSHPGGLPLGCVVELIENELSGSKLRLRPAGILPIGHLIGVEIPAEPQHLAAAVAAPFQPALLASYVTASSSSDPIQDVFEESFDDTAYFDQAASVSQPGISAAEWSRAGTPALVASAAITGGGELGPFTPASGASVTITLDTNFQLLPLLDGSTPRARPGTTVLGGTFHFTDIVIPANVTVRSVGTNPLILTATGSVRIAGTIDLSGRAGNHEFAFDSALFPVPGGPAGSGGGRGGVSHPTLYFPAQQFQILNLITPPTGEDGYGPPNSSLTGGVGGRSLIRDDPAVSNPEISCSEGNNGGSNDGSRGAHGGGGSLRTTGTEGLRGWGNMQPQADHTWIDVGRVFPRGGAPGPLLFADGHSDNDFLGPAGESQTMLGGSGGGGGGSKAESYYCGRQFAWGLDENGPGLPDTVSDARGGGGGGGGGAVEIRAVGAIEFESTARLLAIGGTGGGGETTGGSNWGGGGGGGSGGVIVARSGTHLTVQPGARLDVSGGGGNRQSIGGCTTGCGGSGLVQLQVPVNATAQMNGSIIPGGSWLDPQNVANPVEFGAESMAISGWIDLGRTVARAGDGSRPTFLFRGTDAAGKVIVDAEGLVPNPDLQSFRFGYLGQLDPDSGLFLLGEDPIADFIPTNATVHIDFQGADAIAPGSKEVDDATLTPFDPDPRTAEGLPFIRFRVRYDITADGSLLAETTRRPALLEMRLDLEF